MSVPSNVQSMLSTFASNYGGTSGEPYTLLYDAINNSSVLGAELSSDITNGYLKGFSGVAPGNFGAQFDPSSQSIDIPINGTGSSSALSTQNEATMVFIVAHEQSHSQYDAPNGATTQEVGQFVSGVQQLVQAGGNQNFDSLIQTDQQAHATDEATAQIAGWNAYVNYEQTINPIVTATELAVGTGYAKFFMNPDGTQLQNGPSINSSNFTVDATNPQNVNAGADIYFYKSDPTLGVFGDLNNPNYYGVGEIGTIARNGGIAATINFSSHQLNPSQIAEGLSQSAGASKTIIITDSSSNTI